MGLYVLIQSLLANTSRPFHITPIQRNQLTAVPRLSKFDGWSLYCESDFIFEQDLSELWNLRDENFHVMICSRRPTGLVFFNNRHCLHLPPEVAEFSKFNWIVDHSKIGALPQNWTYDGEEERYQQRWYHYHSLAVSTSKEFSEEEASVSDCYSEIDPELQRTQIFDFGPYGRFHNMPPVFKQPGKKTDYLQLRHEGSHELYLLKFESTRFRGLEQKIPYIKTQCIGSYFAEQLGLRTQDCNYLVYNGKSCLLLKDVRNQLGHLRMDPICYFVEGFNSAEINQPFWLSKQLEIIARQPVAYFYTKLLIFDLLIANHYRDARSLRVFFKKLPSGEEQITFDVLIENNFGISQLLLDSKSQPLVSEEDILHYIIEHNTFREAYEFFDLISIRRLSNIILESDFLSESEKQVCQQILSHQFQKVLKLKENLKKYKEDQLSIKRLSQTWVTSLRSFLFGDTRAQNGP